MKINFLFLLLLLLFTSGCREMLEGVYFVDIQNNSNDTIWCYESYVYPDTSLATAASDAYLQAAWPKEGTSLTNKEKWEDVLVKDTLIVFIISNDTLKKYPWAVIRSEYKILRRYDLSVKNIKDFRTIMYPPTEAMKNIKMWPPYGQ